jgi:hypothetical protein
MTASPGGKFELSIVLTATITPNQVVAAGTSNPETRLAEYIKSLQFYRQFAPVIFLENSGYPLERHFEFAETARLRVKKFAPSANPERGKGYQEFEMLDAWLAAEPQPPARWLKISGRYQMENISDILQECSGDLRNELIIDQILRSGTARTYQFCVTTAFYQEQIAGACLECDDRNGNWIERVLFQKFKTIPSAKISSFKTQPLVLATSGGDGRAFPKGRLQWRVKQTLRSLNRLVDRKYLRYQK